MNEIFSKTMFILVFMLMSSFIIYWKTKLEIMNNYHTLDFVDIDKDFTISGVNDFNQINYNIKDRIYILGNVPSECQGTGKRSIKCLAILKENFSGVYNGKVFISGTDLYTNN